MPLPALMTLLTTLRIFRTKSMINTPNRMDADRIQDGKDNRVWPRYEPHCERDGDETREYEDPPNSLLTPRAN